MDTITLSKIEYSELLKVKDKLAEILEKRKKKIPIAERAFLSKGFGILKDSLAGDSRDYVNNLRKEWR